MAMPEEFTMFVDIFRGQGDYPYFGGAKIKAEYVPQLMEYLMSQTPDEWGYVTLEVSGKDKATKKGTPFQAIRLGRPYKERKAGPFTPKAAAGNAEMPF